MELLLWQENYKMILIPLIAGLIGWLTNWIAVKMLFHPKKPIHVLGLTIQGVFHRRQNELASRLGNLIETKLFSHEDIHDRLTSPEFSATLTPVLERQLDVFLAERFTSIHPMLALIPESMIETIREKLVSEFESFLPHLMDGASESLAESIQIKEVIREKVEAFDVSELEEILFSILKNEFKMIEVIGGVVGLLIGLVQVLIFQV